VDDQLVGVDLDAEPLAEPGHRSIELDIVERPDAAVVEEQMLVLVIEIGRASGRERVSDIV
jgi:hypothetical protein